MLSFGGTSKRFQFGHITGQLAFERLGNYVLRYNWFKIDFRCDCHVPYSAMFKVTSTTTNTLFKAQTMCKTRFGSRGVKEDGF